MSRYNLRSRRSGNVPGQRMSGGDGPPDPNNDRRGTLPMRLSARRDSMRAQAGSRRPSQLSISTRTSGSSGNSRSSRPTTNVPPASVDPETDEVQNADDVPPPQEQQAEEPPSVSNLPSTTTIHRRVRWTTEMNKFLLRTFLELSSKNDKSSAYAKELRDRFVAKFPQVEHLTPETVMRQKARICNKHVLTKDDIEDVQKDIQGEAGPSVSKEEQPSPAAVSPQQEPATVTEEDAIDDPMCDPNNNDPESRRISDTQLEYNFSNTNDPDNDNEELPKLAQENQFTLNQEIPKRRDIE